MPESNPPPADAAVRQTVGWFDAIVILGRKVTDRRARAHNLRVARLCVRIGRQLSMSAKELRLLARAGLLHDVGSHQGVADPSGRELRAILYQHERLDGSGFPHGLRGDAIPIEARILGVADTYDELISERAGQQPMTPPEARRYLEAQAGRRFDPKVVRALVAAAGRRRGKANRTTRRILAF